MSLAQAFLGELEHEASNTRKMFEALPDDQFGWKPHDKSYSLGRLASHVAEAYEWVADTVNTDGFNFAEIEYKPPVVNSKAELLQLFDANLKKATDALKGVSSEEIWGRIWSMRQGDHVIFEMPKVITLRGMVFNHIYHHRGQLAVYLRLLNKPVPGMYGPSADEMETMPQTA